MIVAGIDIGTTTISGVLADTSSKKVLRSITAPNNSSVSSSFSYHHLQNPQIIEKQVTDILEELSRGGSIKRIGVTGQMHGILYVDQNGVAVSPMYTWQDLSGNCLHQDALTYSEYIKKQTGYASASGFGCVTHFYLQNTNQISEKASYLCTIGDYIAMRLSNGKTPLMHSSNAASLGLYDVCSNCFDRDAMSKLSMNTSYFPPVEKGYCAVGKTKSGIPVGIAIGDNQASFLGAIDDFERDVSVNIGTGGQISCYTKHYITDVLYETRPFMDDSYLLVSSSLCGGRAYAALEHFFRKTLAMCGIEKNSVYDEMGKLIEQFDIENPLSVQTLFCGTRKNPELRGEICGISLSNFTPEHMIHGFMHGVASELYPAYEAFCKIKEFTCIKASGNAVRKNNYFKNILQNVYSLPVITKDIPEEAAYGAAIYAARI